jgi:hypothetical protein
MWMRLYPTDGRHRWEFGDFSQNQTLETLAPEVGTVIFQTQCTPDGNPMFFWPVFFSTPS